MEGEKLKILCPDCKRNTNHLVVREYNINAGTWTEPQTLHDGDYEYPEDSRFIEEIAFYQIVQCMGCDHVSYRQFKQRLDPESEVEILGEEFFPIREYRFKEIKDFGKNLPENIFRLYKEVILTFNGKMEVLCAAGIRAVIEGICNERNISAPNLEKKIDGLVEEGIFSKQNAGSLHQLRFIGNEAVHQLDRPSEDELKNGIDIIENTLESIYEIIRKGEEIERHKSERKRNNSND